MNYNLYFWQNIISPHQADLIQALAVHPNVNSLTLIIESEFDRERKSMGWGVPELESVKIVVAPIASEMEQLLQANLKGDVHIFSGISAYPLVQQALKGIRKQGCWVGVMSETGDWKGLKGKLRILKGIWERVGLGAKVDFILTIGERGEWWYTQLGYSPLKIFRFAYFSKVDQKRIVAHEPGSELRLLFVGRLIPVKGLTVLFQALHQHKDALWKLKIIGDGEQKDFLLGLADELSLSDKIEFLPFMSYDQVQLEYQHHDLLVLPSIGKDGWGMVTNEALLSGLQVLVSSYCGSSELVKNNPQLGYVIQAGSQQDLFEKLVLLQKGQADRTQIADWASRNLGGKVGGEYLIKILEYLDGKSPSRPVLPWLK